MEVVLLLLLLCCVAGGGEVNLWLWPVGCG
jgi:hypothetical protein